MSEEEDLTYGRYLRIGELLELQQPRSRPPHPEELHFIIVHQAIELWMKLLLHDLERIIAALAARRDQRSLAEAHLEAGRRLGLEGIERWADLYASPGELASFYLVCEALVDYDERWARWRAEHVALVERSLGDHARGTGGMALTWLRRTTRFRFFPVLWALRDELVVRGGGELVGKPGPPVAG